MLLQCGRPIQNDRLADLVAWLYATVMYSHRFKLFLASYYAESHSIVALNTCELFGAIKCRLCSNFRQTPVHVRPMLRDLIRIDCKSNAISSQNDSSSGFIHAFA